MIRVPIAALHSSTSGNGRLQLEKTGNEDTNQLLVTIFNEDGDIVGSIDVFLGDLRKIAPMIL